MPHDFNLDNPEGAARDIRIAASELLAVLWTTAYASGLDERSQSDIAVAHRLGIPIVVCRWPGAPAIPSDRFPAGTRVVDLTADTARDAVILNRLSDEGAEWCALLT